MQERHSNRQIYFEELAHTSKKYFLPYIQKFLSIGEDTKILEIGCGDGGNLLPFAEMGCNVTGVDIAESRILQAKIYFEERNTPAKLIASDIFKLKDLQQQFDLILIHDVIEHIHDKETFLQDIKRYLKNGGMIFIGFPAWQMPFGGHQQICRSKLASHWPFLHLLPNPVYRYILKSLKENDACIRELMDIKSCKTTIEMFEKLMRKCKYEIVDRTLYFINPHYETKFNLKPRRLSPFIGATPYIRNFFCTSTFYMIKPD